MEEIQIIELLKEVVKGNWSVFPGVTDDLINRIEKEKICLPKLVVTKSSLLAVVMDFQKGILSEELAQKWASFIRWKLIGSNKYERIVPIEIDYDEESEDTIAEVLMRLDELGDIIDGTIEPAELESWIKILKE